MPSSISRCYGQIQIQYKEQENGLDIECQRFQSKKFIVALSDRLLHPVEEMQGGLCASQSINIQKYVEAEHTNN